MPTLSEQYDSFIQGLEEKGVPNPKVLVPLLAVALLAAFVLLGFPDLFKSQETVSLTIKNLEGQPVSSAEVELFAGGESLGRKATDASGSVAFKVSSGKPLQVRVSHSQYQELNRRISPSENSIILSPLAPPPTDIRLQVVDEDGQAVSEARVVLSFDDGTSETTQTDDFGDAKLTVSLAPKHAAVEVIKEGFTTKSKSFSQLELQTRQVIELKKIKQEKPPEKRVNVLVRVTDVERVPIADVRVTISDATTATVLQQRDTDTSGQAYFEGLLAGKKIRLSVEDPAGRYVSHTDPFDREASEDPIRIELTGKKEENRLVIRVKDNQGNPISEADVTLYDRNKKTFLTSHQTGVDGKVSIFVEEKSFYVSIYKDGFLPVGLFAQNNEEKTVTLQSAEGNTVSVGVTVKKAGEVIPSATVQLFGSNGFPLGIPSAQTGADGTVSFTVPQRMASFYAAASIESAEGRSDVVTPSEGLQLIVQLEAPKATYTVVLKDVVSKKPVKDARVAFIQQQEKRMCTSNAAGECTVEVPTETEFTVTTNHQSFLPFASASVFLPPGTKRDKMEVRLYPRDLTGQAAVEFMGFFNADGRIVREVENAQRLKAKFLVTLPPKTDFSRFVVFSGARAQLEEESMVIRSFEGPKTVFTGLSAADACTPNEVQNSSDNDVAHWAAFDFPKGFAGSQELVVEFSVKETAKPGEELVVPFQLYGTVQGVPFLLPLDDEKLKLLLALSSVSPKDFCASKTRVERIKVARDSLLCQDGFCTKFVFVQDSVRSKNNLETQIGKEFSLEMEAVNLKGKITQVSVFAPPSVDLLSLEPKASNLTLFASSLSLPLDVKPEEKAKAFLKAKALRATNIAEIKISWETDAGEKEFARNVIVKGTNRFTVDATPKELEAAVKQRIRITVKDKLGNPVNDAAVTLYECEQTPLNGQDIEITEEAQNGVYSTQIEPSSIGMIGVRVKHEQFQTFDSCSVRVLASDFLSAEPLDVLLKGDTRKDAVREKISLSSTLPATKIKVTSSIVCFDNQQKTLPPFIVSPKTLTLKETTSVDIEAKKTTSKAKCEVTFFGEINKDNKAQAVVQVNTDLTGPPAPEQRCPANAKCLSTAEGTSLRCTKTNFLCEDEQQTCFACNLGPHTLPSAVTMSVSNYQPDDTQTFAIALEEEPQECRVEGFRNNPTYSPLQYNNPFAFGQPPYGIGQQPYAYWQYRPNSYLPSSIPPQNDPTVIAKLSPYCQQFFTSIYNYNNYQNYYSNSFRDPWSPNLNPQYPNYFPYTYPQNRPTVSVSAQCSRTELVVSAQYVGGDFQYGGGLGGLQQGFLLIRTGGQTKKVPVTVNVVNPFSPISQQPPAYIPPECLKELQDALKKKEKEKAEGLDESGLPDSITVYVNKYTGKGVYERKLDVPSGGSLNCADKRDGTVKLTCTGSTMRAEANCPTKEGTLSCKDGTFQASFGLERVEQTKKIRSIHLVEDTFVPAVVQLLVPETGKDSGDFPVSVGVEGDFTKAKCIAKGVTASCETSSSNIKASASSTAKGTLEIRDMGDYQIREIPVHASLLKPKELIFQLTEATQEKEQTAGFQPKLTAKPNCVVGVELQALETKECNLEKIVLKASRANFPENKKGLVAFHFDESQRKSEEQYPRLSVQVQVKPVGEIELRSVEEWIVSKSVEIFYTFPASDVAAKRKITVTKPDGSVTEPVQPSSLSQSGDIRYTPEKEGKYVIKAATEVANKIQKNAILERTARALPARPGPQPGPTQPAPGQPQPPSPPSGPPAPAPAPQTTVQVSQSDKLSVRTDKDLILVTATYLDPEKEGPQTAPPGQTIGQLLVTDPKAPDDPSSSVTVPTRSWVVHRPASSDNYYKITITVMKNALPQTAKPNYKFNLEILTQADSTKVFKRLWDTKTLQDHRLLGGASLSNRCKGSVKEMTCWLSTEKAEYRCTPWLDNNFGLCVNHVGPDKAWLSVSGGDGKCGGYGQTNFEYSISNYKECGKYWTFKVLAIRNIKEVGNVVDVSLRQKPESPSGVSVDKTPLLSQGPNCVKGNRIITCSLKPGVAKQRCTETTAKGAAVCVNSITGGRVQLKTVTQHGTCHTEDNGLLRKGPGVKFWGEYMVKGDYTKCDKDVNFGVSIDDLTPSQVQVTVADTT